MHELEPGVVRSFTLATRARPGFARIVRHYGDGYAGWPADFYMAHVRLLGTHITASRFGAFVAPIAAKLARHEKTVSCPDEKEERPAASGTPRTEHRRNPAGRHGPSGSFRFTRSR